MLKDKIERIILREQQVNFSELIYLNEIFKYDFELDDIEDAINALVIEKRIVKLEYQTPQMEQINRVKTILFPGYTRIDIFR